MDRPTSPPSPGGTLGGMVLPRRIAPAVGLFFLAPLVAEFLLGNLPVTVDAVRGDPARGGEHDRADRDGRAVRPGSDHALARAAGLVVARARRAVERPGGLDTAAHARRSRRRARHLHVARLPGDSRRARVERRRPGGQRRLRARRVLLITMAWRRTAAASTIDTSSDISS